MNKRTITLIIHGTFASGEKWWRLGNDLFADRLEKALERQGLQGTVWSPALETGFDYKAFAWSGRNAHRDRVKAGRKLGQEINSLAERLNATSDRPLTVHLVGHSHGGNVILEAMKWIDSRVQPGRIVLLGTPLLRVRPAFRLARLLLASILTSLATFFVTLALISPLVLAVLLLRDQEAPAVYVLLGIVGGCLLTILLSNVFGFARLLLDGAWWCCCLPFMILKKRWRTQAYGPQPGELSQRLGGRRILALWSPVDEAGLALLLSAAPRRYLQEKIHSELLSYLDFVLFDYVIDIPEALLEKWVLGVGWLQVLFADFKVSEETDRWAYPDWVVDREDVTGDLQLPERTPGESRDEPVRNPESQAILDNYDTILSNLRALRSELHRNASITGRVSSATSFAIDQIRFLHSLYYDNDRIVERVARAITTHFTP